MKEVYFLSEEKTIQLGKIIHELPENACDDCELKNTSDCCGAPIIMHDICADCREHCGNICDNCDFNPNT